MLEVFFDLPNEDLVNRGPYCFVVRVAHDQIYQTNYAIVTTAFSARFLSWPAQQTLLFLV